MFLYVARWTGVGLTIAAGVALVGYLIVVGLDEANLLMINVLLGLACIGLAVSERSTSSNGSSDNSEIETALYNGLVFSTGIFAPIGSDVPSKAPGPVSDTANDPPDTDSSQDHS